MFQKNADMVAQAHAHRDDGGEATLSSLEESGRQGRLWDLTRLVNRLDDGVDHAQTLGGMMELFGVAHGVIRRRLHKNNAADINWIFTTTELMVAALQHLGVKVHILSTGRIRRDDTSKSFFCMVAPEKNVDLISTRPDQNDFAFTHMNIGLKKSELFHF